MAADPTAILQAVQGVTTDPHVIDGMMVGSYLESGWDPTAVGDGSYGPWQLQLNDGAYGGVTDADAESPTFAAQRMVGEYTTAAADVPDALWTSNPELAAETTAYKAERPKYDYYEGQGTAKVNAAWAATVKLLSATPAGSTPASPTAATTTSIWSDITNPVGAAAGAAEKSVASIAMEMLGVAAAIGLIIVGAVKTASPGTKVTGGSGQMPAFGGGGSKGGDGAEAGGGLEDAALLA